MSSRLPMVSKVKPLATMRSNSVSRGVSGDASAAGAKLAGGSVRARVRKRSSTRRAMPGLMGAPPARSSWMLAVIRSAEASFSR